MITLENKINKKNNNHRLDKKSLVAIIIISATLPIIGKTTYEETKRHGLDYTLYTICGALTYIVAKDIIYHYKKKQE